MKKWFLDGSRASLVLLIFVLPVLGQKKSDPLARLTPVPANEIIPVVDFFRFPQFSQPKLNPAGTHFAAIVSTDDDRADLLLVDVATRKMERLKGGSGMDIPSFDWLNDKRILFSLIKDKMYSAGLYAVEVGRLAHAYPLQQRNVAIPVGFPQDNPLQLILWIRQSAIGGGSDGGVVRIDTRRTFTNDNSFQSTGSSGIRADVVEQYSAPDGGEPVSYVSNRAGHLAFAITAKEGVFSLHTLSQSKWTRSPVNLGLFPMVGVGDRAGEILTLGPRVEGRPRALYSMDSATGRLGEMILEDADYDLTNARLYRHPVDRNILGVQYSGKGSKTVWLDPGYRRVQLRLEEVLKNQLIHILGSDLAEKNFFLSASSDVQPAVYYYFNLEKGSCTQVANVRPWIDSKRMRPMQVVAYKARDGRPVQGYLTLPTGASKERPAPLVVLPHGGPWVRDNWQWDPEVQFLASRGYAVFQPNYRGSTGTDWQFPEDDRWEFRKMHDDVTDGVKALLKTGLLDKDRVAIMGGSFGGYLALSGAAHEGDLYRCAITIAGVFDWEQVMKQARGSEYLRGQYGVLKRNLGDPKKQAEKFAEISPIKHIARVKIPIYVAHGTDDVVASVAQSKQLISELKKHGVPHEKQIESGEGHGFYFLDHQVELYTAIEAFLGKHLAPRKTPSL